MTGASRRVEARLRSARTRDKARAVTAATLADPAVTQTLLLAGNRDGSRWWIVPGGMLARHMAEALLVATEALKTMADREAREGGRGAPVRIDVEQQDQPFAATGNKPRPGITVAPDGSLRAPHGETFVWCGECGASRWFTTIRHDDPDVVARMICVGCGNELTLHQVANPHTNGTA